MIMALEKGNSDNSNDAEPAAKAADLLFQVSQGQRFCLAALGEIEPIIDAHKQAGCPTQAVDLIRRCALAHFEIVWTLSSLNEIGASLAEAGTVNHE